MSKLRPAFYVFIALLCSLAWGAVPANLAQMFDYKSSAPLDLNKRIFDQLTWATVYEIDFASPRGGRVTGFLVIPNFAHPRGGIVFGHWGSGDKFEFLPEALLYAKASVASVMIDYPWVRPEPWRRPLFSPNTTDEADKQTEIQAVVDLRRSIDVLFDQPGMRHAPIAYIGHSFGAQFGAILTAVDRRFAGSVLMAGAPSYHAIFIDGTSPEVRAIQKQAGMEALKKAESVMTILDAIRYVPFAAPTPLYFQFARYEQSFSQEAMRAYFQAASEPKKISWYRAGHEMNDQKALSDRADWISSHLKIPALRIVMHTAQEESAQRDR
jgi:cephalosporin-C deacetylase-like acetyl esterase